MIEPTEQKHELSLSAHSMWDYQSPIFAELSKPGTDSNTRGRRKMKVPDYKRGKSVVDSRAPLYPLLGDIGP